MAEVDFSDPQHRIDNLTNMRFVRLWAALRHHVFAGDISEPIVPWLQGYMMDYERQVAEELGLPTTTLVGRLVDLGRDLCSDKDGQDQGGVPTA